MAMATVAVRRVDAKGYAYIGQQAEHRLVWREHNGPIPRGLSVHHINGVKDDNRIENLMLVDTKTHSWIHNGYQQDATGEWRKTCAACGKEKALGEFPRWRDGKHAHWCKGCYSVMRSDGKRKRRRLKRGLAPEALSEETALRRFDAGWRQDESGQWSKPCRTCKDVKLVETEYTHNVKGWRHQCKACQSISNARSHDRRAEERDRARGGLSGWDIRHIAQGWRKDAAGEWWKPCPGCGAHKQVKQDFYHPSDRYCKPCGNKEDGARRAVRHAHQPALALEASS
jgi:hypothetical protein